MDLLKSRFIAVVRKLIKSHREHFFRFLSSLAGSPPDFRCFHPVFSPTATLFPQTVDTTGLEARRGRVVEEQPYHENETTNQDQLLPSQIQNCARCHGWKYLRRHCPGSAHSLGDEGDEISCKARS